MPERKREDAVVECGRCPTGIGSVAGVAGDREVQRFMVGIGGAVIISKMTGRAFL